MKKAILMVALATGSLFFNACTKQDMSNPAPTVQSSSQDEASTARTTPAPGNYKVRLYIDDNDTSTQIFKGYVFNFASNGVLKATVNNVTYVGTWEMKDGGTEMKLEIEGTPALEKIDKSWDVDTITNKFIVLLDNDPGEITKLAFQKI